jgi:hypothetical protein
MVKRRPHHDVVQFLECVVRGGVAQAADQVQLRRDVLADFGLEPGVVDARRQVIGVRNRKMQNVIQIVDDLLGGPPGVDAGRPGITEGVAFGPGTVGIRLGPADGFEEGEVAHVSLSPVSTSMTRGA